METILFTEFIMIDVPLAMALGDETEAAVLCKIHLWMEENKKANRNFKDGRYWTFNTYTQWQEQFPFWSDSKVRRIIKRLEKKKLLISTDKYNKFAYDNTKWYTINDEVLEDLLNSSIVDSQVADEESYVRMDEKIYGNIENSQNPLVKMTRPSGQNDQTICSDWTDSLVNMDRPIPNITTNITSNINTNINNMPPRRGGGNKSPDIDLENFNLKIKDFLTQHEQFYEYPLWSLNQQKKLIYWSSEAFKKSKADIENEKHQQALITALGSVQRWFEDEEVETDDDLTRYFYKSVYNALKKAVKGESPSSQKPNKSNKRKKPIRTELEQDWTERYDQEKREKDKKDEEASKNIDPEKSRKEIDIMNALIDESDEQKKIALQSKLDALQNEQVIISETAKAEKKKIRAILDDKAPLPIGAIIIPSSGNESIQTI